MSPELPPRIGRLEELANNMWWSWHEPARQLFRTLDYPLWRHSEHNPVQELKEINPDKLRAAAADLSFLAMYDTVMADFDADLSNTNTWFAANYPALPAGPIGYFSMEYAIHNSLPIYAGGLGILAGDVCKEASDLGLPFVAVGFMYPQGYFHQHISLDGRQEEFYRQLDFSAVPIKQVRSSSGDPVITRVKLGDASLGIGVWLMRVGRTRVYLLDTNLEGNSPPHRQLSARLYTADREMRIEQEIVLGIGGVRVLRQLGINPVVWHANEGHAAFMMLERTREEVTVGLNFDAAMNKVRAATVFTTHTPVLAGHDVFSVEMMDKYFNDYFGLLGINRETFLHLGRQDNDNSFNMTALALRMAGQSNAVSRLHGQVTRRMWQALWPQLPEEQVPISHITNGVHGLSWIALDYYSLFDRYLGEGWPGEHDDAKLWERLQEVPDGEFWQLHLGLKRKLVGAIRERLRKRWMEDDVAWGQMMAMGAVLDPDALTISFARRFTEYKRPSLILRDSARLKRIINSEFYPVQIIFAGKSHPADFPSKHLLSQVYNMATNREFEGRIAFLEDYDIRLSHYLVQGVDVWLNNPRRLQEACGTSGMKAAINGVLNLSVPDGWWYEGYNGRNGWSIGADYKPGQMDEDANDAEEIYRLLEQEIIPMYYDRDRMGVPHRWVRLMKESIRSVVPAFSARRMLKEYVQRLYRAAAGSAAGPGS
jgi:glycogen phosphorylase